MYVAGTPSIFNNAWFLEQSITIMKVSKPHLYSESPEQTVTINIPYELQFANALFYCDPKIWLHSLDFISLEHMRNSTRYVCNLVVFSFEMITTYLICSFFYVTI